MELAIVIIVLAVLVARTGAQRSHLDWQRSRSANRRRTRGQRAGRRAWSAVLHDAGYWLHQVTHGLPQFRHGIASGWHSGRTAQAEGSVRRAEARTEHLSARRRLAEAVREQRRRQEELLAEMRGPQEPEPQAGMRIQHEPDGPLHEPDCPCGACRRVRHLRAVFGEEPAVACEHEGVTCMYDYCPCPCLGCGGDRHQPADGAAYSYGAAGNRSHWPAKSRYEAERQAQYWSTGGTPQVVAEYPPGGGPGTTVSRWVLGEPADCDADADDGPRDCVLCGQPLPAGQWWPAGSAHPACTDKDKAARGVPVRGGPPSPRTSPPTTEGTTMSDVTYDGVLAALRADRENAETRASEQARAIIQAQNTGEAMQTLNMDAQVLGAMADHLDAQQAAHDALSRVMETAEHVTAVLTRNHQALSEAHKDAPVRAAKTEFYED